MRRTNGWVGALFLFLAPGCTGDDESGGEGEGEGEEDAQIDILVDAADGVLTNVQSVRAYFLESSITSCDGLTSRRVHPDDFPNRRAPVLAQWTGPGNPHVVTSIANGSSEILIEAYLNDGGGTAACSDGTACTEDDRCLYDTCVPEPQAAGCQTNVYVAPGQRLNTSIQVRLNP